MIFNNDLSLSKYVFLADEQYGFQPMLLRTLLVGRYYVPSELKIHMMGGYEINLKGFLSPYRDPQVINSHLMSIIIIRYLIIIIDIK